MHTCKEICPWTYVTWNQFDASGCEYYPRFPFPLIQQWALWVQIGGLILDHHNDLEPVWMSVIRNHFGSRSFLRAFENAIMYFVSLGIYDHLCIASKVATSSGPLVTRLPLHPIEGVLFAFSIVNGAADMWYVFIMVVRSPSKGKSIIRRAFEQRPLARWFEI